MGLTESSRWNTDQYLKRIHMERPTQLNREYLDRLVTSHLISVPFENMDLYLRKAEISMDLDDLFDKIVVRGRGGYCFELNKMFQFLLKDLGFQTYPCACRVWRGTDEIFPVSHRGNIVYLDGQTWYCDVGFGNFMSRGAIALLPGVHQKVGEDECWFEPFKESWFNLFHIQRDLVSEDGSITKGEPRKELCVCTAHMEEVDFLLPNSVTSGPDSSFRERPAVGRLTEEGAVAVNYDMVFSVTRGNQKTHRMLQNQEELIQVLKDEFGIVL